MMKLLPIPDARTKFRDSGCRAATPTRRLSVALLLTVLLCIVVPYSASAAQTVATKTVTLNMHNATLSEVFKEIERQTGAVFVSNADDLKKSKRTNANYTDTPVEAVLDDLLKGQNLGYTVTEDYLTIYRDEPAKVSAPAPSPAEVEQTTTPFSGRVISTTGVSMVGVTVVEKGTNNGVITDVEGRFTINLTNPDAVLQFSMIGYRPLELPTFGNNNQTVNMEEVATGMDEVIVVAYGTQRKSSLTGSIATVSGSDLATVSSPDVSAMLQGKVAGVQVTNTSGRPGEQARIRIRGKSSLGPEASVDPLWVVDGVIAGTGSQVNPNDIETMSILKDASATALYGSRATNGVIIVTTKSGRIGENRINVSAKFGMALHNMGKFKLMNGRELYDYTMSMDRLPDTSWLYDRDKVLSHDTDWLDLATQTGFTSNYTVSHTMGTEKVRNFLSGDYYRETGSIKGFKFDRYTVRDNIDIKVNDRLSLHVKVAASMTETDDSQHDIGSAINYLPWDYPYNEDGTIRTGQEDDWYGRDATNYLYNRALNWERSKQLGINGTFGFDYKITDWLTFESNNNIGYRYTTTDIYVDPQSIGAQSHYGSITSNKNSVTTRYTNQLLRFNYTLKDVHAFNAFLGYEFSDYSYENTGVTGNSIPAGYEVLDVSSIAVGRAGGKQENATQSYYFNVNYTYDNRYNAQFSFRRDGSSKFGLDSRYGNFWTVGFAWSVDREKFMENVGWVDYLKVRGSYGSIGNSSSLGNYNHYETYDLTLSYNGAPAAFPTIAGNPNLRWEKCYEANIGIDARLFDRVGVVIDLYNKNTSGLLYQRRLTSLAGFAYRYENIGAVGNKGLEITLSPEIIRSGDWNWSMDFNFGLNRNEVKELANDDADQFNGNYIFRVGYDRDTYYMPQWAGVDPYTGGPLWYQWTNTGERRVTSAYDEATQVLSGSATPKWFGGISTAVSYKSFTLSAMGNFVYGNKIYHYARQFYDNDGAYPTYNSMKLSSGQNWKRWGKPGDIATHPKPIYGGNNLSNSVSTRYLEDGSFFRLTNVTFAWDLPQQWLDKIKLKGAQVYVSGENLWTLTKFSGTDPEVSTAGNNTGIADVNVYPAARRFTFGINFSF